ncbi:MAG: NifB/NifX family molybdenum-iron cluster-binding protein [Candidatus Omnitrophica bacterium]|nr:NifB/NifX family molybdenum-iron cluster-binding protein [Candidatus Omnitrophota bacterium]
MRICIPTETKDDLRAEVYAHFGSAPYFVIYDTEKETIEMISNSNQHHLHGMCQPLDVLSDKNIDIVISGGMGMRAIQKLNETGIRAYRAIAGTVGDIIKRYKENALEEITADSACREHNCH